MLERILFSCLLFLSVYSIYCLLSLAWIVLQFIWKAKELSGLWEQLQVWRGELCSTGIQRMRKACLCIPLLLFFPCHPTTIPRNSFTGYWTKEFLKRKREKALCTYGCFHTQGACTDQSLYRVLLSLPPHIQSSKIPQINSSLPNFPIWVFL